MSDRDREPRPPTRKLWWKQVEALMGTRGYWYCPEVAGRGNQTGRFVNHAGLEVRLLSVNLLDRYGLRLDCYVAGQKVAVLPIGEDGTVHQRSLEKVLGGVIRAAEEYRAMAQQAREGAQRRREGERWLARRRVKPYHPVAATPEGLRITVRGLTPEQADSLVGFMDGMGVHLLGGSDAVLG